MGAALWYEATLPDRSLSIHLRCSELCPSRCLKWLRQVGHGPRQHYTLLRAMCVGGSCAPAPCTDPFDLRPPGVTIWGPSLPPEHPLGAPRDTSTFLGL